MCYNEPVSWLTFCVGTFLNLILIYKIPKIEIMAIAAMIEYALLMQIFEAMIWRNQNSHNQPSQCLFYSKLAMFANITQPIATFLFLVFLQNNIQNKIISTILILIYSSYLYFSLKDFKVSCVKPTETCPHLFLNWWNKKSGLLYLFTLISILLLLLKPNLSYYVSGYILLTFLISYLFYCNSSSIWCWFIALAPLFLMIKI